MGDVSRADLMMAFGLKDRMHFARDYLQPALTEELIEMTVPERPNSRLQKYRLTEKGRTALGKAK